MLEYIFYVMGSFCGIGVIAKAVSAITIRRMVKAASEVQKSNHRLIKLIKAKFEHASMINDKVQNVEALVDKYLYEYKILGIKLQTWRTIPKKMLLFVIGVGSFSALASYRLSGVGELLSRYVQWTFIFVLLLLLVRILADEESMMRATRNYLVDYLENVCAHRYAKAREEEPVVEAVAEEPIEEEEEPIVQAVIDEEKRRSEQEMRIRAILEEFLA